MWIDIATNLSPNLSFFEDSNYYSILEKKIQLAKITSSPGSELWECIVIQYLWLIIPLLILLFGTIGNILAFVVLFQRSKNHLSYYSYFCLLTVVDQLILVMGLFRKWVFHFDIYRIDNRNQIACASLQCLNSSLSWISTWLLMFLTIYRAFVICFPFSKLNDQFRKNGKYLVLILFILTVIGNSHFFFTVEIVSESSVYNGSKTKCKFKQIHSSFVEMWTWIDATVYCYFPSLMICISNIFIVSNIIQSRKVRCKINYKRNEHECLITINPSQPFSEESKVTFSQNRVVLKVSPFKHRTLIHISTMLLSISCCFIITTAPIVIIKGVSTVIQSINNIFIYARYELVESLAELLMYLNHGVNFYIYLMTGSKFRKDIKVLLTKHCE